MSKHNILTQKEFSKYHPHPLIVEFVEGYRKVKNLKKSQINILDWGCGRGKTVLWLKEKGYNAFGVDIDPRPIKKSLDLYVNKGYSQALLYLIDERGITEFPDNFFHIIFSYQVFEHIKKMYPVALELNRITKNGGIGLHIFPGHKHFIEGHLKMPFIHWFPKNKIRKFLIYCNVIIGREPHWKELKSLNAREKAERYYKYSTEHTYYRSYSKIQEIFKKCNFQVRFITLNAYKRLKKFKFLKIIEPLISHLLLTFIEINLILRKI